MIYLVIIRFEISTYYIQYRYMIGRRIEVIERLFSPLKDND